MTVGACGLCCESSVFAYINQPVRLNVQCMAFSNAFDVTLPATVSIPAFSTASSRCPSVLIRVYPCGSAVFAACGLFPLFPAPGLNA